MAPNRLVPSLLPHTHSACLTRLSLWNLHTKSHGPMRLATCKIGWDPIHLFKSSFSSRSTSLTPRWRVYCPRQSRPQCAWRRPSSVVPPTVPSPPLTSYAPLLVCTCSHDVDVSPLPNTILTLPSFPHRCNLDPVVAFGTLTLPVSLVPVKPSFKFPTTSSGSALPRT